MDNRTTMGTVLLAAGTALGVAALAIVAWTQFWPDTEADAAPTPLAALPVATDTPDTACSDYTAFVNGPLAQLSAWSQQIGERETISDDELLDLNDIRAGAPRTHSVAELDAILGSFHEMIEHTIAQYVTADYDTARVAWEARMSTALDFEALISTTRLCP